MKMAAPIADKRAKRFDIYQLLYPEVLSVDDLRMLLRDRCIQLRNMDFMTRDELLAVVRRVAMPLPQRPCPGQTVDTVPPLHRDNSGHNKQSLSLENCINFKHKVIKLNKSGPSTEKPTDSSNGKSTTKVSLKRTETRAQQMSADKSKKDDSPPEKKRRTKITWP